MRVVGRVGYTHAAAAGRIPEKGERASGVLKVIRLLSHVVQVVLS